MKILVVTNMYPTKEHPYFGVFVKEQVENYRKLYPNDNVDLLHVSTPKSGGSYLSYFSLLIKLIWHRAAGGYDVVHCHHAFCTIAAKLCGFRNIVYTNHEGEYFKKGAVEKFKLLAISWADRIIFVNKLMKEQVNHLHRAPSYFIPCGLDYSKFLVTTPAETRRALVGLKNDDFIVFFPANPSRKEKGFERLNAALVKLKTEFSNITCVTGGTIPYEEMVNWYAASDLVVSCSDYESDGMIYKESILTGRYFLTPDVGNARYYSNNGKFGQIYSLSSSDDLYEKLRALILEPHHLAIADDIPLVVTNFEIETVSRKIKSVYKDALKLIS
ncbi:glycosyltransferase family 4 protein [Ferrimonas balearica]|uniref:glycosyltransferase family 4 protein n=1 Tax=Ferrimonas balearica TaxID=44012 RepID=UPI001C991AA7|nr:glycosyltransferase family 4 protein [Ferrimonas balearica]MBY5990774.1 glycosyltransferase family 4 protein [Ferrimonas balearica]